MRVAGRSLHFALIPFLIPRMLDENGFNPAFWTRKAQDGLGGVCVFPEVQFRSAIPNPSPRRHSSFRWGICGASCRCFLLFARPGEAIHIMR